MNGFNLPLKSFYLIRHGESEANLHGLTAGISDVSLTVKGRQQAKLASMVIDNLNLINPVIYASPLIRVQNTAEIISQGRIPIITITNLQERNFGVFEGEKWSVTREKMRKCEYFEDGDSVDEFVERCHLAFDRILNESLENSNTPLVIAHAGTFDSFGRFYNLLNMFPITNCGIYHYVPSSQSYIMPWEIFKIDLDSFDLKNKVQKKLLYF